MLIVIAILLAGILCAVIGLGFDIAKHFRNLEIQLSRIEHEMEARRRAA